MTFSHSSRLGAGGWRRLRRGAAALAMLVLVGVFMLGRRHTRRHAAAIPEPPRRPALDVESVPGTEPLADAVEEQRPNAPAQRTRWAGIRRLASIATMLALVTLWGITLRPTGLGGPAGYVLVSGTSMEPGLSTGDLVITQRRESYERGDVIAYEVPDTNALVIHRVIGGSARTGYKTRGDNREGNDLWRPKPDEIRGRQIFTIPQGGKFVALLAQPLPLAFLAAALAFTSVGGPLLRRS